MSERYSFDRPKWPARLTLAAALCVGTAACGPVTYETPPDVAPATDVYVNPEAKDKTCTLDVDMISSRIMDFTVKDAEEPRVYKPRHVEYYFGDGTSLVTSATTVRHQYTAEGTYDARAVVTLEVAPGILPHRLPLGSDQMACDTVGVIILDPVAPQTSYAVKHASSIVAPVMVQ